MDILQALRDCEVFAELTDEELQQIVPLCREERHAKDSLVFREDEEAQTLYILQEGRLTAFGHCLTDVRVIAVDSKALNELMEENSHIGFVIVKELAGIINHRLKDAKGLTLRRLMGSL
jgi:CRP-like cAMP-binding protein